MQEAHKDIISQVTSGHCRTHIVRAQSRGQRNLENEAENFAKAYKRTTGVKCHYVNRHKQHEIMDRCMEIVEEGLDAKSPLFVIVLRKSICTDDSRIVPMLTHLKHLSGGWAFSTKPFRCKTLDKEPSIVVFVAKAPPAKTNVSRHWKVWPKCVL